MLYKKRIFQSLRTELILFCLPLLAIPSITIGVLGYETSKNQLNAASKIQLKNDVRLVNDTIHELNIEVKDGLIPLKEAQEHVKEMILGPKDFNGHRPINKKINLGKNGYFFIFDEHGTEVAHPFLEGKNLWNTKSKDNVMVGQAVVTAALNGGGFTYYMWPLPNSQNDALKITYSEKAPAWGWIVCAGSYMQDYNSGANQVLYILLITLGIALILGFIFTWYVANRISKPILAICNQVHQVATGDLTIEPIEIKSKNEIGRLSHDFKVMTSNLKEIIYQVSTTTEQLAASSKELHASAEQVSDASGQIVETIQDVSTGTDQQATNIGEITETITQSVTEIQQISNKTEDVSDTAADTSKLVTEGNCAIQKAIQEMNSIQNIVNELSNSVKDLGDHSQTIGLIVNTISGISSQTNLLALNAAIEAARAGEHGRGFSVVADEVRKLAEQSAKSAKQISELIGTIQIEISKVVKSTDNGTQEVLNGIDAVNMAGEAFTRIQESIHNVTNQIQEVSASVHQVSVGSEQVANSIAIIAEAAETTASGTQTISATTEEQLASMEEITASASSLSRIADDLQQTLNKFKI